MLGRITIVLLVTCFTTSTVYGQDAADEATRSESEGETASVDPGAMDEAEPTLRSFRATASHTEIAEGGLFGIQPDAPLPSTDGFEEYLDDDGLGHRVLTWTGSEVTLDGLRVSSLVVRVKNGVVAQMEVSITSDDPGTYKQLRQLSNSLCESVGTLRRTRTGFNSPMKQISGKCRGDVERDVFVLVEERHSSNESLTTSRSAVELTIRHAAPPRIRRK